MAWKPATRVHEASFVALSWPTLSVLVLLSSDNLQTFLLFFDTHSLVLYIHSFIHLFIRTACPSSGYSWSFTFTPSSSPFSTPAHRHFTYTSRAGTSWLLRTTPHSCRP
jgi:hypothetical protein